MVKWERHKRERDALWMRIPTPAMGKRQDIIEETQTEEDREARIQLYYQQCDFKLLLRESFREMR